MHDLEDMKKQIRADFALTWGLQADMTTRLEAVEHGLAGVEEQVRAIKNNLGQQAEISRRLEGHLRHQADRFDVFLSAVSEESASVADLVSLEARIESRLDDIERRLSA